MSNLTSNEKKKNLTSNDIVLDREGYRSLIIMTLLNGLAFKVP